MDLADASVYVMTPEYGAPSQLEKIDMLDLADVVVLNKFDKLGAEDALREVRKQYKRSRELFQADDASLPVYATVASQFNDPGTNLLFSRLVTQLDERFELGWPHPDEPQQTATDRTCVIPPERTRYLAEIAETVRGAHKAGLAQAEIASRAYAFARSLYALGCLLYTSPSPRD